MKIKRLRIIILIFVIVLIAFVWGIIALSQPRRILKEGINVSTFFVRCNGNMMENVNNGKISEVLCKYKCQFAFYRSSSGYQMDNYPIDFCTDHFDSEMKQNTRIINAYLNWYEYILI